MAKLSLLDIVQDIANDLETDEINSINDTVEAIQIAQIVKTTFFEMMAHRNWPHLKRTFQMESSLSVSQPTHVKLPIDVKEVVTIRYNKQRDTDTRPRYETVEYLENEEFLNRTNDRNSDNTNVDVISDTGGIDIVIMNDRAPEFYTSFDDEYVVFDAYDSAVDTTIQTSKTQVVGYISPAWVVSDTHIPDLPEEAFPALLEEAKSTSFIVLKQAANEKVEQKAQRQHRWLSRKAWRVDGGVRYPDFGRRRNAGHTRRSSLIDKNNKGLS